MKVLAEIPARPAADLGAGSLRRGELDAFGELLERLGGARSVVITGAEGASRRSAALGLAATAAAGGSRVALLECDMVDPGLADALGLANAPGLHEYLRGDAEREAVLAPVVLAGPGSVGAVEPLVCVVAGRPASDGWALLASDRFRRAVEGLRAGYELTVIDGPALADDYALRAVLELADTSLACVAPGRRRRRISAPVGGLIVQG